MIVLSEGIQSVMNNVYLSLSAFEENRSNNLDNFYLVILMRRTSTCPPCHASWKNLSEKIGDKMAVQYIIDNIASTILSKAEEIFLSLISGNNKFSISPDVWNMLQTSVLKNDIKSKVEFFHSRFSSLIKSIFSVSFVVVSVDAEKANPIVAGWKRFVPSFHKLVFDSKEMNLENYKDLTGNIFASMFRNDWNGQINQEQLKGFVTDGEINFLALALTIVTMDRILKE